MQQRDELGEGAHGLLLGSLTLLDPVVLDLDRESREGIGWDGMGEGERGQRRREKGEIAIRGVREGEDIGEQKRRKRM